ncbi:hypothetical protein ACCO45_011652 [Purpureocillium lilacinum]|uniref:Uncharacterized protein n=1 Tax=Purpureocillium lilacinum TaxID=33203 RepID=A0ACC4DE01_PURLI
MALENLPATLTRLGQPRFCQPPPATRLSRPCAIPAIHRFHTSGSSKLLAPSPSTPFSSNSVPAAGPPDRRRHDCEPSPRNARNHFTLATASGQRLRD